MNISMLIQMPAEAFGERIALTHNGQHYSYSTIYNAACAAAQKFKQSGCRFVVLLDVSSPAAPIALFGAALAGIPYVPLNYRLSEPEVDALLERVQPAYLVAGETHYKRIQAHQTESTSIISSGEFTSEMVSTDHNEVDIDVSDSELDIAVQLFTSGTTGAPKAALLRHQNLMSYILNTVEFASADESESNLSSVPPYHIAGIAALLSLFYACRRVVQLPDFSPGTWLSLVKAERVSHAFVVPTMLSRLIQHIEENNLSPDLSSLTSLAYGGGKMPLPVISTAMEKFPHLSFTNAYGLTETSSSVAILGPNEHRDAFTSKDPAVRRRLASVGKPLPGIELKICNEDGASLGPNEVGEVVLRGEQISGEYRERDAKQTDGWFATRDHGYVDDAGYLYLQGRIDDIIVRGGENISPGEIEAVLHSHEDIADVAVVGVADKDWGETVAAAIVLRSDVTMSLETIQTLVKAKLRSSRVPSLVKFVDELPYNETGKLLRRVVKADLSSV